MIPRFRPAATPAQSTVPTDTPRIPHLSVDWTWVLSTGQTVTHTSLDGDAPVEETPTHYVMRNTTGRREIRKDAVLMFEVFERTFETDPPLFEVSIVS